MPLKTLQLKLYIVTAVANTTIGVVLLAGGGIVAAIGEAGPAVAVAVLAVPALAAALLARGLPELEQVT